MTRLAPSLAVCPLCVDMSLIIDANETTLADPQSEYINNFVQYFISKQRWYIGLGHDEYSVRHDTTRHDMTRQARYDMTRHDTIRHDTT